MPDRREPKEIGRRLALSREAVGLNQTAYAQAAGIANTSLSEYENGVSRPSIDSAISLCDAHGLTLDWIFLGEPSGLDPKLLAAIVALRGVRK